MLCTARLLKRQTNISLNPILCRKKILYLNSNTMCVDPLNQSHTANNYNQILNRFSKIKQIYGIVKEFANSCVKKTGCFVDVFRLKNRSRVNVKKNVETKFHFKQHSTQDWSVLFNRDVADDKNYEAIERCNYSECSVFIGSFWKEKLLSSQPWTYVLQ